MAATLVCACLFCLREKVSLLMPSVAFEQFIFYFLFPWFILSFSCWFCGTLRSHCSRPTVPFARRVLQRYILPPPAASQTSGFGVVLSSSHHCFVHLCLLEVGCLIYSTDNGAASVLPAAKYYFPNSGLPPPNTARLQRCYSVVCIRKVALFDWRGFNVGVVFFFFKLAVLMYYCSLQAW